MSKETSQETIIGKVYAAFPETKTTGVVTRAQLRKATSSPYLPNWLAEAKVDRGLYAIPGGKIQAAKSFVPAVQQVVVETAKETEKSVVIDYSNINSLIPEKDSTYVPFGNYTDLEMIIRSKRFYPTFITGPTGNGKSMMIEQICAKLKRPLIRINLNMLSDEEQLIGTKTLEDGNVKIVEGPVLIAMRAGIPILLDEIDAGQANTLMCLQSILEGKPYYFKLKNEKITPTQGFNIFAAANTKGKGSEDGRYMGTNVLNEAFLERFAVTFEQEYPSAKVEIKIINNLMKYFGCENPKFAETLVKWAEAIRKTNDDGGIDENITTRRIAHIVQAYSIFGNTKKAIQLCCNRFDKNTKEAFLDLFDKVSDEPAVTSTAIIDPETGVVTSVDVETIPLENRNWPASTQVGTKKITDNIPF